MIMRNQRILKEKAVFPPKHLPMQENFNFWTDASFQRVYLDPQHNHGDHTRYT